MVEGVRSMRGRCVQYLSQACMWFYRRRHRAEQWAASGFSHRACCSVLNVADVGTCQLAANSVTCVCNPCRPCASGWAARPPPSKHAAPDVFVRRLQTGRERLGGAPAPSNGNAGRVAGELVPTDDGAGGGPPRSGNGDGGRGDGDG